MSLILQKIQGAKESTVDGESGGYLALSTRISGGNNTEKVRITSNGNVGIGTTNPMSKLQVAGRIRMDTWTADGNVAVYYNSATGDIGLNSSDARLKKNLEPITGALTKIEGLQAYLYNPIKDEDGTKKRLGLLAQDVISVGLPEATYTFTGEDNNEYYGIHYETLTALLVEGMKEQQARLSAVETAVGIGGTGPIMDKSDDQITNISEFVNTLKEIITVSADNIAIDKNLVAYKDVNVLGKTTLSEVGITGKLTVGLLVVDGLESTDSELYNPTTNVSIKSLAGDIVLQDFVTITKEGNVEILGSVTLGADTLGTTVILAGQTKTFVDNLAISENSEVFITPKTVIPFSIAATEISPEKGFTVEIPEPIDKDIYFSWAVFNKKRD